jgi:hypothetical protein
MVSVFIETGNYEECSNALNEKYGNHPKFSISVIKYRI